VLRRTPCDRPALRLTRATVYDDDRVAALQVCADVLESKAGRAFAEPGRRDWHVAADVRVAEHPDRPLPPAS